MFVRYLHGTAMFMFKCMLYMESDNQEPNQITLQRYKSECNHATQASNQQPKQ